MNHKSLSSDHHIEIKNLFQSVFTDSEGNDEGKLIAQLVEKLSKIINNESTVCYGTFFENELIASIFFTKLFFPENILIYMLAPVAVSTSHQGKGVGQSLIKYGLQELKNRSSHIAVTYGDPAFYSKVGFEALSEKQIQAPLKMSIPEGWLGLTLTAEPIPTIPSKPTCVEPFNDPTYW